MMVTHEDRLNSLPWWVSGQAFTALTRECQAIAWGGPQLKVLKTPDGLYIKLFKLKRKISSGLLYPYSVRFARNARRLNGMGIPSVNVTRTFFVPSQRLHCVVYEPLLGTTFYDMDLNEDRLHQLGEFIAHLHHKGVYFRSLHLGNVVQTPAGELGLIDVADLSFKKRPLKKGERKRNWVHILRRQDNLNRYGALGVSTLLDAYRSASTQAEPHTAYLTDVFLSDLK